MTTKLFDESKRCPLIQWGVHCTGGGLPAALQHQLAAGMRARIKAGVQPSHRLICSPTRPSFGGQGAAALAGLLLAEGQRGNPSATWAVSAGFKDQSCISVEKKKMKKNVTDENRQKGKKRMRNAVQLLRRSTSITATHAPCLACNVLRFARGGKTAWLRTCFQTHTE